ncbi:hypothetical protein RM863_37550 [Streptomyces sp. DSM 41014]|uniref:Secreted protein n=1 Tax=Streptomyces hintoniae TaxID=3075521 RepID=A0ABU2UX37_9ACTN|nr:hypothetical protein [Streptomyces sp. DSM 41014]MDT0477840.1 hypothetical protein [Streptomyces sp. DSM 41014]
MNAITRLGRSLVVGLVVVPLVLVLELLTLPVDLALLALRGHRRGCPRRDGSTCSCFLSAWRAAGRGARNGLREAFAS